MKSKRVKLVTKLVTCDSCDQPRIPRLLFCGTHLREEQERYLRADTPKVSERSEHTPTPWVVDVEEVSPDRIRAIYGADGSTVVETDSGVYNPNLADAEFIVLAVNSHAELISIVQEIAAIPSLMECHIASPLAKRIKAITQA